MSNTPSQPQQVNVQVRFDESTPKYANQVLLNPTPEEVFLDFSPGLLPDPNRNAAILPVNNRVVMTPQGAFRFYQALGQALQKYQAATTPAAEGGEVGGS